MRARIMLIVLLGMITFFGVMRWAMQDTLSQVTAVSERELRSASNAASLVTALHGNAALQFARELASDPVASDGMVCEGAPLDTVASDGCLDYAHHNQLLVIREWMTRSEGLWGADIQGSGHHLRNVWRQGPELVVMLDSAGVVIARAEREFSDWFGPSRPTFSESDLFSHVMEGKETYGYMTWRNHEGAVEKLLLVAMVPIEGPLNRPSGAAVVGFEVSDGFAATLSAVAPAVDVGIAYRDDESAEYNIAGQSRGMNRGLLRELEGRAYTPNQGREPLSFDDVLAVAGVWAAHDDPGALILTARAGTFESSDSDVRLVVTAPRANHRYEVEKLWSTMVGLSGLLALLGLVGTSLVEAHVMRPIEEITAGVQAVIAGDVDFMWPVDDSSPFADLSHQLNVMSARLQGKADPDSDPPEATGSWAAVHE